MMIGGGSQERRAVLFARRLGYRVVLTDRDPASPCAPLADEFHVIDGRDIEGLVSLACALREKRRLHGVFTLTELVTSVAAVSQAAELPGTSIRSAVMCQDKGWAKRRWLAKRLSTPRGAAVATKAEARRAADGLEGPLVLKPSSGFGGKGVARFTNPRGLLRHFDRVSKSAHAKSWIIEEFAEGSSHDANGLFDSDGRFHPLGIVDRGFVSGTFAEESVQAPTRLGRDQQRSLYSLLRKCALTLGISSGPVKGDAILSGGSFWMLEIAPRLHGPKMSLFALPESRVGLWKPFLSVLTGGPFLGLDPAPASRYFASRAIRCGPGKIRSIGGLDAASRLPGVVEVMCFKKPGERVTPPTDSTDIVGYVLAAAKSTAYLEKALSGALEKIRIRMVPSR